jgi:hypothetical protein
VFPKLNYIQPSTRNSLAGVAQMRRLPGKKYDFPNLVYTRLTGFVLTHRYCSTGENKQLGGAGEVVSEPNIFT